jgi:hypothetical protein
MRLARLFQSASTTVVLLVMAAAGLVAQAPTVAPSTETLPPALAAPVAALMAPEGVTVSIGETSLHFWWVRTLPLEPDGTDVTWRQVPSGALAGAVRLDGEWHDIRGYTIRPGVYTLRFAMQPQNGDHMGISPYREFLLLAPASLDETPDPLGYDGVVKLSTKASRRSHPASMSLDPPSTNGQALTLATNEFDHDVVLFSVPAARNGADAGTLTFGLVVQGTIEH